MKTYAIILAAGKGTRMCSDVPKVMHTLSGLPMIEHVVRAVEQAGVDHIYMVVGHEAHYLEHYFDASRVTFVHQTEQLGTGHAVLQVAPHLVNKQGTTVIVTGDTPLLTSSTITDLMTYQQQHQEVKGIVLTTTHDDPTGYGRVIVNSTTQQVERIVEEKDANASEKTIQEVNTGIFCFDNASLFSLLPSISNQNAQTEYYLTDMVALLREHGETVHRLQKQDAFEFLGVNDRYQLSQAESVHQQRIKKQHMQQGVRFLLPDTTYIETDVTIEPDATIEANVTLKGRTHIASNVVIETGSVLENAIIETGARIRQSVICNSTIGAHSTIGPFAHIRPHSVIDANVRIGNFVETKQVHIGAGTKISHLSYIGDATVGEHVTVGCGAITVNYDGKQKHQTTIGDHAFIGCNSNLIAPVTVAEHALIAAGSTITDNVPASHLAIARMRQTNKPLKSSTPQT